MGKTEFDFRPLLFVWWVSMLETNYTRTSFCRTAPGHA